MIKKVFLHLGDVGSELLELTAGVFAEAAHLLAEARVFWWGAGSKVVTGLVVECVDGCCHHCVLIL